MKKSLLALAVLGAFAGVAQAQTSVTIYGSFDAGVRYQSNQSAGANSKLTMGSNGTYNSNRIGFKGVEDLGGGLNAHFTLEQGFNSGTGQLDTATNTNKLFNRSAFVGLGGQWGSLDLGRQYTVAFKTVGAYDPFNYKFTSIIPTSQSSIAAGTRFDNDIQYTGTFGPITARAEWALGEQAGGARNGSAQALGVTYANGPLSVGGAYTLRKPNVGANGASSTGTAATSGAPTGTPGFQDNRDWTLGGAYTFGPARVALGYARETQDLSSGSIQQKNWWVGGSYDLTPALGLTAAYYDTSVNNISGGNTSGKRQLFIIGSTYALSKRTNLYADIDYARFKDGLINVGSTNSGFQGTVIGSGGGSSQLGLGSSNGQSRQLGVSVGVNHLF
jgi:predicted porin